MGRYHMHDADNLLYSIDFFFFFYKEPTTWNFYSLPLPVALPIPRSTTSTFATGASPPFPTAKALAGQSARSEEHTSEIQSHVNIVCRLLLEKKKRRQKSNNRITRKHSSSTRTTAPV